MSDQDENVDNSVEEESLASRRTRRSRGDKGGRAAALEKLKNLSARGSKNKYEVADIQNVYDVVDEDTYSKKVNDRLKDDWIVDDTTGAASGYCETGHELFDDDLLDEDEHVGRRKADRNRSRGKKDKQTKEERNTQKAGFLSVRDMLTNMPVKRKRDAGESSNVNDVNEDDLLGDLMQELHEEKKSKTSIPSGTKLLERTKAAEKFISAGKIHEEKPFTSMPKITLKKKFQAFKIAERPEVKEEPIENVDEMIEDFSEPFEESASEVIEDFSEDMVAAAVKLEAEETSKAAKDKKPSKGELQLQEVEDFETYRQVVGEDNDKPTNSAEDNEVDFMTEGTTEENKILNFYWFDIYEEPKNPGNLYLFGKVNASSSTGFQSCCVILKNVERCLYLLPKETDLVDVSEEKKMENIYNEVLQVAERYKIGTFKAKTVEKKYCFDVKNVPLLSKYLEVRYSGSLPVLPDDLSGKTFSKVFGTSSSLLENLLLEKKLKGPCWLQIKNPVQIEPGQQQSWCKIEFSCEVGGMKLHPDKDQLSPPPLVVASLNVNSLNDASAKRDTIISISVAVNKAYNIQSAVSSQGLFHDSFCLLNKPAGEVWPFDVDKILNKQTCKMDSERSMLGCFLAKIQQYDPDVYIGHDINLDLLLLQLWNHKVPHWSRIGRLKRSSQPQKGGKLPDSKAAVAGRLVCDVKISAMELIRARSYDLPTLSIQVLGMKEDQVLSYTGTEMRQLFESSEGIQHLSNWGMSQSILNIRLVNELQVMPLALQITTIAGNTLSRTLLGGRSERNEFLLLHAFHSKGYIVPDKAKPGKRFKSDNNEDEAGGQQNPQDQKSKPSGPSYLGGLVLEPKKGFYDNFIVLMDFLSLYPSIIQEFNICFTTSTTDENRDDSVRGILPEEIRKLVESRRQVKKLMQAENVSQDLKRQYDIRQKALKLTANSMYGCLGFRNSRFYAKDLAAMITGKGRDILMKTKETVEKMGFEVIYGDTDSLMINTNTQDIQKVYQIGNKIRTEINRMYKLLELEIDGVFRFLLLLKKKKYAAMLYNVKPNGDVETTMELKGLDIVRRDWAPVAATTAKSILDEIMTEQPLDDKIFKIVKILSDKADELRAGKIPIKDLLITKQLAKNPDEYKGRQGLYHVDVALRMNSSGKLHKKFKNGDTVSYLFCTDRLPHHPAELMASKVKAKPEEVKTDNNTAPPVKLEEDILEPDPAYYLSQQVHPVVSRICEPIPGLDGARIAEALGMDPSSYKRRRVVEESSEDRSLGEVSEAEKYRDCVRFSFFCADIECHKEISLGSPFVEIEGKLNYTLTKCSGCKKPPSNYIGHVGNQLNIFIRSFIEKYYQGWYMCEDPSCTNRERAVSLHLERGYLICPCKQGVMMKEYSDSDLHKQLNYLLYAFDINKRLEELSNEERVKLQLEEAIQSKSDSDAALGRLTMLVNKQLQNSSYSEVRLGYLFMDLIPPNEFSFIHNKDDSEKQ